MAVAVRTAATVTTSFQVSQCRHTTAALTKSTTTEDATATRVASGDIAALPPSRAVRRLRGALGHHLCRTHPEQPCSGSSEQWDRREGRERAKHTAQTATLSPSQDSSTIVPTAPRTLLDTPRTLVSCSDDSGTTRSHRAVWAASEVPGCSAISIGFPWVIQSTAGTVTLCALEIWNSPPGQY